MDQRVVAVTQPLGLLDQRAHFRFIADQNQLEIRQPLKSDIRSTNNNVRRVIAAHGVQGECWTVYHMFDIIRAEDAADTARFETSW